MTRAVALLDPGRHPWRYGCAIGLRGGFATSILDAVVLVVKGQLNGPQITDLAAVAPALIAIEAGLIVSGYAILGRYLGLRPTRAASAARA